MKKIGQTQRYVELEIVCQTKPLVPVLGHRGTFLIYKHGEAVRDQ